MYLNGKEEIESIDICCWHSCHLEADGSITTVTGDYRQGGIHSSKEWLPGNFKDYKKCTLLFLENVKKYHYLQFLKIVDMLERNSDKLDDDTNDILRTVQQWN